MKTCQKAVERGNPSAISDAAVGALLADAALCGGVYNVLVNLSALDDKHYVQKMENELRRLKEDGGKIKEQILAKVYEKISG